MSCYFSHLLAETGSCDFKESLNSGFPLLHSVKALNLLWATYHKGQRCLKVVCSQTSSQTGMSVRDIWLSWQGKDPTVQEASIVFPSRTDPLGVMFRTVHIYYIHIQTVVREVNKGLKCVNLIWQCLLPLARNWSLLELSPHLEPTREVLPQTVKNSKWPGVWGLLGLATTTTAADSVPPC